MASMAAGSIDVTKAGKYPIVLSDALLGKTSSEVFTGVRFNHKPNASSNTSSLHLQPADDPTAYDLSFKDDSDTYSYSGARKTNDGRYVLIFDPAKEHFVLHQVDSTFDMNLVGAPWADAATLRSQYPQLESHSKPEASAPPKRAAKANPLAKSEPKRKKAAEKPEPVEKPKKPKPVVREPTPDEEESDDGLTIEYPDGPNSQQHPYMSTPVFQRQESEASDEDSDADADGDFEEERNQDVDHLKLPSPANNNAGMSEEELELDLEAEMEAELEQALNRTANGADESSESEEE